MPPPRLDSRSARRLLAAAAILGGLLVGCNLVFGIEEQPLRATPEDAGADAEAEAAIVQSCTKDADCIAPNGCYTPHCDTVLGACTYALCEARDRTCAMGTCNEQTFACSDPLPYGFHTTTVHVDGVTSGCGATPEACVTAAFPFVFLGTRDDVVAIRADDLTGSQAPKVAIKDLGTKPAQLIGSGRRVWVLGAVQGQAPPYQLSISTIDVPSDPSVPSLEARTTLVTYPFPTAVGFAAPNGALFLVHNDPAQGFPAVRLDVLPPSGSSVGLANAVDAGGLDAAIMTSEGALTMFRETPMPIGTTLAAASGTRLVAYRYGGLFNLIPSAGTKGATTQPDQQLQPLFGAIGAVHFAQGPDGVVAIAAPIAADTDCNCTTHQRLQYVLPNAIATTLDANLNLDLEGYANPVLTPDAGAGCHKCAGDYVRQPTLAAWVDRRTMLTAAPMSGDGPTRNVTDVRLLGRDPLDGFAKRRYQLPATDLPAGQFGVDRIGLTSSNGIGYLVVADGQGNNVSLSIFDPRCDVR